MWLHELRGWRPLYRRLGLRMAEGSEYVCAGMDCGLGWTPAPGWCTAPLQLQVCCLWQVFSH